jgi:hypothetical protein
MNEERGMSVEEARALFSRTVHAARLGTLDEPGARAAVAELAAIRDRLDGPRRRQVDLYLRLLEQEWVDTAAAVPGQESGPLHQQARQLMMDAFEQPGEPLVRLARARSALEAIARLAQQTAERTERMAIARLSEPLLLLISKLESELPAGASR